MISPPSTAQDLQLRHIDRKRLLHSLVLSAVVATLLAGCNQQTPVATPSPPVSPESSPIESDSGAIADPEEPIQAVFYQTTEQCQEDIAAEQKEYETLLVSYQQGSMTEEPTAPVMTVDDCEPQMQAALEEHNRTAPVYSTLEQCQSGGAECETTTTNSQNYYRPSYGGSYFYPYRAANFIFFNYGGTNRRIYQPYPVYQSTTPGNVVTSTGRTIPQTTSGSVTVPRHTSFSTPARSGGTTPVQSTTTTPSRSTTTNRSTPSTGTSTVTPNRSTSTPNVSTPSRPTTTPARGTVNGRGNSGFGSTFKGTGRGGK